MAVRVRPGLCPAPRAVARILSATLLAFGAAGIGYADVAAAMPRISAHGDRLYAGSRPWRAWGLNWGIGDHAPVVSYFDDPTVHNFAVLTTELRNARQMGANSMRIYLQLGQVMVTPTQPRQSTLTALQRLLVVAQTNDIYLDITSDLVWQPWRAPGWYGRMSVSARWRVQARLWRAVAHAAAGSPAVLCYELTSEPTISDTGRYYSGQIGNWYFNQSVATGRGAHADLLARSWTRLLANAVRSQDNRPVTVGLLPNTTGPFAPANVADLLDMIIVHEYPASGQAAAAVSLIRSFAQFHKPVLLGETFMLNDDGPTQSAFLSGSARYLVGAFEFFDGRNPVSVHIASVPDAVYQASLQQFEALRPLFLSE